MKQISPRLLASLSIAGMVTTLFSGCGEDLPPPPTDNRNVISAAGDPVGHLKPNAYMPKSEEDAVTWVIRGDEVTRRDEGYSVHGFRLDFDETISLTEDDLPYVLMTETTRQVVIHRSKPATNVLTHREINEGERMLPAYYCANDECPRYQELDNFGIFPHDPSTGEATCPFCNEQGFTGKYELPQHGAMRRFLDRKQAR